MRTAKHGRRLRLFVDRLRPFWPTAALVGALVVAYLAFRAAGGGGLGVYADVTTTNYSVGDTLAAIKLNLADLLLTSGLAPASALILLTLIAFRNGGEASPAERAFLAVSVAAVGWLLIQVGLFSSRFAAGSVVERYLFYVMPLLFLALAVWLGRGLPRPWLPTAIAAIAPAALLAAEPLTSALSESLIPSSLGLFAFYRIAVELGSVDELAWLIRVGAVGAALAFAVLWRPLARIVIPIGLVAFLLLSSRPAAGHLRHFATASRGEPALGANPQWIDDAVGGEEVAFLFTASSDVFSSSRTMLEVNFWNPAVRSVVSFGTTEECPLPERHARIDPGTGRIVAGDGDALPRHVVGDAGLEIAGKPLARQGPLVLHRATAPLSLRQRVEGVYIDGWMGAEASFTRYAGSAGGNAVVTLSREFHTAETVPSPVRIDIGPLVRRHRRGAAGRPADRHAPLDA